MRSYRMWVAFALLLALWSPLLASEGNTVKGDCPGICPADLQDDTPEKTLYECLCAIIDEGCLPEGTLKTMKKIKAAGKLKVAKRADFEEELINARAADLEVEDASGAPVSEATKRMFAESELRLQGTLSAAAVAGTDCITFVIDAGKEDSVWVKKAKMIHEAHHIHQRTSGNGPGPTTGGGGGGGPTTGGGGGGGPTTGGTDPAGWGHYIETDAESKALEWLLHQAKQASDSGDSAKVEAINGAIKGSLATLLPRVKELCKQLPGATGATKDTYQLCKDIGQALLDRAARWLTSLDADVKVKPDPDAEEGE